MSALLEGVFASKARRQLLHKVDAKSRRDNEADVLMLESLYG